MPVFHQEGAPPLGPSDVLLPSLKYEDGPYYFEGATEQAAFLQANGYNALKTDPEGEEGVVHFDFGIDFNAVLVGSAMLLAQPLFQVFLGVLGNYIYDQMKVFPSKDDSGREYFAQLDICVRYPEGATVSINYKGTADQYQEFFKADHGSLFAPIEPQNAVDPKDAPYIAARFRDVYHRPNCRHLFDGLSDETRRDLIG